MIERCPFCNNVRQKGRILLCDTSADIVIEGKRIVLTPFERRLIEPLILKMPNPVDYDTLIEKVWPSDEDGVGIISDLRILATKVRKKLSGEKVFFFTSWGYGYGLRFIA